MTGEVPLKGLFQQIISEDGPLNIEAYMAMCLSHPRHGYYMTRDPLGRGGDFTTSPEISQMFGELIGLWAAGVWQAMGAPSSVKLVELGPGRGTLMADALRAAAADPAFRQAIEVHLVEISPVLRAAQEQTLAAHDVAWHASFEDVPPGPAIIIANEFLDALPIRQFRRQAGGWHEIVVGLDDAGELTFGLAPEPNPGMTMPGSEGDVLEVAMIALSIARQIAARVADEGGAALIIDYGAAKEGFGDTLQAVKNHAFVHPLAAPGQSDLTVHVAFEPLSHVARGAGAAVHGPVPQADFLEELGLPLRAGILKRKATPEQAHDLDAAAERLTDRSPTGMGALFKAMAIADPRLPLLPGLGRRLPPKETTSQ